MKLEGVLVFEWVLYIHRKYYGENSLTIVMQALTLDLSLNCIAFKFKKSCSLLEKRLGIAVVESRKAWAVGSGAV